MPDLLQERLGRVRVDLEVVRAYLARVMDRVGFARSTDRPLADPRVHPQLNTLKLVASDATFRAVDLMIQLAALGVAAARAVRWSSNAIQGP